jgi:hypothetical protein
MVEFQNARHIAYGKEHRNIAACLWLAVLAIAAPASAHPRKPQTLFGDLRCCGVTHYTFCESGVAGVPPALPKNAATFAAEVRFQHRKQTPQAHTK